VAHNTPAGVARARMKMEEASTELHRAMRQMQGHQAVPASLQAIADITKTLDVLVEEIGAYV